MLAVSSLLYQVAGALDGGRALQDVACDVSASCRRRLSVEDVAYLIEGKLRPLGVVEGSPTPPGATPISRPVLGLTVRAGVVPKPVVRAVADVLRPLFRPSVVVATCVGVAAADVWLGRSQPWGKDLRQLFHQPAFFLTVVGLTLVAGVFHELGHATATRYGGAEPGTIGAGLYLVWPVFYNDLNDSYRLSRAGRLRADLGGVYFNAIFILVVAGGYGLTGFKALVTVVVVQHLSILQQFLPFVRLDGYYVVSDLVGVPDLFGRIRPILRGLVPGRVCPQSVRDLQTKARVVVTVWVLLTVLVLGAGATLFSLSVPRLMRTSWHTLQSQGTVFGSAIRHRAPIQAMLSGLQLFAMVVPLIGVAAIVVGLGRRRRSSRHRPPQRPDDPGDAHGSPRPKSGPVLATVGAVTAEARRTCAQPSCGNSLPPHRRGRPAIYCSSACWPSRRRPRAGSSPRD
jgi:putative peptide zinc metalloprotease protein